MQKRISLLKFKILSIIFVSVLGVILHFTFDWSNKNLFVGAFSATNESTWEHLKLIFYPMLISTIIGWFYFKDEYFNYICARTRGIIIAMSFTVIFFYTYTGILGTDVAIIDIATFFIAVILGECYSYKAIKNEYSCNNVAASITLIILFICFIVFTFYPPQIGLFKDPINNEFGLQSI